MRELFPSCFVLLPVEFGTAVRGADGMKRRRDHHVTDRHEAVLLCAPVYLSFLTRLPAGQCDSDLIDLESELNRM